MTSMNQRRARQIRKKFAEAARVVGVRFANREYRAFKREYNRRESHTQPKVTVRTERSMERAASGIIGPVG
jgi:hypothetical protein